MPSAVRLAAAPLPPSPSPTTARAVQPAAPAGAEASKRKDSFMSTLSSLTTAIAAGDIEGAQQALDATAVDRGPAYTRATPPGRGPVSTPAHSNSRWNRQADFQDLVAAVRLGDLSASQQALEAFETKGRVAPVAPPPNVVPEEPAVPEGPVAELDETPTTVPELTVPPETDGIIEATLPEVTPAGVIDIGVILPTPDVALEDLLPVGIAGPDDRSTPVLDTP